MNKKGSMELSVNSIVILVIAIVMLGLILGFVRSKFSVMDKQFVQNEPDAPTASSSEPITVSRPSLVVNAGEQLGLKFQVYALTPIASTDVPSIDCTTGSPTSTWGTNSIAIEVNGKTADEGTIVKYEGIVRIPNGVAKGKYLCSLWFGSTADYPPRDLMVEIV
jgi:hypothetical protein